MVNDDCKCPKCRTNNSGDNDETGNRVFGGGIEPFAKSGREVHAQASSSNGRSLDADGIANTGAPSPKAAGSGGAPAPAPSPEAASPDAETDKTGWEREEGVPAGVSRSGVKNALPPEEDEEERQQDRGIPYGVKRAGKIDNELIENAWTDAARAAAKAAREASLKAHDASQEIDKRYMFSTERPGSSGRAVGLAHEEGKYEEAASAHDVASKFHADIASRAAGSGRFHPRTGKRIGAGQIALHRQAASLHAAAAAAHRAVSAVSNAALGQTRHGDTGHFQKIGAGTGKGPVHAAAREGACHGDAEAANDGLTDEERAHVAEVRRNMGGGAMKNELADRVRNALAGNAWSDAARKAARDARAAAEVAQNSSESAHGLTAATEGRPNRGYSGVDRKAGNVPIGVKAKTPEQHDSAAAEHRTLQADHASKASSSSGDDAKLHEMAADYHRVAAVQHEHAANLKRSLPPTRNALQPAAKMGFKGADGDMNADDYRRNPTAPGSEYQWATDAAEPIDDEDEHVGQGDRPPDPGSLKRQSGTSKKEEQHHTVTAVIDTGTGKDVVNAFGETPMGPMDANPMPASGSPEHDASQHALGASAATDCDKAVVAAKSAHDKSADGDHTGAAIDHLKAAQAHDDEDRDGTDADDQHDKAAMLHKRAALFHTQTNNQLQEVDHMSRESLLKRLTANCSRQERAAMQQLSTSTLRRLLVNAKGDDDDDDDDSSMEDNDGAGGKAQGSNADVTGKTGTDQAGGKGTIDEYPKATAEGTTGNPLKRPTGNRRAPRWNSTEEFMADAPPEVRRVVTNALEFDKRQRADLVGRLTANVADKAQRERLTANLMTKQMEELKDLVALMPPAQNQQFDNSLLSVGGGWVNSLPAFLTTAGGEPVANAEAAQNQDAMLAPPTLNFDAERLKPGGDVAAQRAAM